MGDGTTACFFPQRDYDPVPPANLYNVKTRDGLTLACARISSSARTSSNESLTVDHIESSLTLVYFHGNGEVIGIRFVVDH